MKENQMEDLIDKVLAEIGSCLNQVSSDNFYKASSLIGDSPRVFVSGAGRSGLIMRALGVRLMHLGKTVYVVGDSTTPGIQKNELLILGSGSGRTSTQLTIAQKAKNQGARILLFTTDPESPLAIISDRTITLPAPSLEGESSENGLKSIQPMGTLFEQTLLIACDVMSLRLMSQTGVSASQMRGRHANLE
jgi:6-phospho-3-hexuloisomerase